MRRAGLDGAPGGRSTIPCPGTDAGGPQRLPAGEEVIGGGWGGSGAPADCGSAAWVSGRAGSRCLSPPPARRRPPPPPPPCACALGSPRRGLGDSRRAPRCSRKPSQAHRRGTARSKGREQGEGEPRAAAAPRGARWRAPRRRSEAQRGGGKKEEEEEGAPPPPGCGRLPGAPARGSLRRRRPLAPAGGRERAGEPRRCRGRGGARPFPEVRPQAWPCAGGHLPGGAGRGGSAVRGLSRTQV